MSGPGSIFHDEPGARTAAAHGPAAVALPQPVAFAGPTMGARARALVAGAGVALIGGLVWAGVVIATKWDVGILAWLVGAATGLAFTRVAGAPAGLPDRIAAGALAAGGILVGKYVIFVHEVKDAIRTVLHSNPDVIGYLDTTSIHAFVHNFSDVVRPIYALWIALAFFAAFRTSAGERVVPRRR